MSTRHLVALASLLVACLPANSTGAPLAAPNTTEEERIRSLEARIESLSATLEALRSQHASDMPRIEQQVDRSAQSGERVLTTITTVFTWTVGALGAVGALLAFFGYQDVHRRIDSSVRQHVEDLAAKTLDGELRRLADTRLQSWDQRFAELANRMERLAPDGK
jgi:hypothetical protein